MASKRRTAAVDPIFRKDRFHVALIIESSRGYGRDILWGIARWVRLHGSWSISWQDRGLAEPVPPWLSAWHGQGLIVRVDSPAMMQAVLDKGVPAVNLRGDRNWPLPLVETNEQAVAQLAFEHLAERGFRHFAYCGFSGVVYSQRRLEAFTKLVSEAGCQCHAYSGRQPDGRRSQRRQEQHGLLYEEDLIQWIRSLPRPVGIMTCNDLRGQQLLNACRQCGVTIPDEAAVVGVDNDRLLCELSDPPLSSVEPNAARIGFEAAAMLDRLMRGEPAPAAPSFLRPKGIVTRHSTDVLAIEDRNVARAVFFIRENACRGITVEDVMRQVSMSRTVLRDRFEKFLGRSPKAEIVRVRLARVKQLLAETDLSLAAVARQTGFEHPEYLSALFKQKTGQTPGRFRASSQLTSPVD